MNKNYLKDKFLKVSEDLRTYFAITKTELIIAIMLFLGLALGILLNWFDMGVKAKRAKELQQIVQTADSLARADSLLLAQDTLGLHNPDGSESLYPTYKRKELPKEIININSANLETLCQLPGVGQKMAEQIVKYRTTHKFKYKKDLMKVKGIGKKKFEKLEPFISVE